MKQKSRKGHHWKKKLDDKRNKNNWLPNKQETLEKYVSRSMVKLQEAQGML